MIFQVVKNIKNYIFTLNFTFSSQLDSLITSRHAFRSSWNFQELMQVRYTWLEYLRLWKLSEKTFYVKITIVPARWYWCKKVQKNIPQTWDENFFVIKITFSLQKTPRTTGFHELTPKLLTVLAGLKHIGNSHNCPYVYHQWKFHFFSSNRNWVYVWLPR